MLPINTIALEGTKEILLKHSHLTGQVTRVERGETIYPRPCENTVAEPKSTPDLLTLSSAFPQLG